MAYKIEIRPLATLEIIEAYDWYELQRKGLGIEFLNELEDFYTTLLRNPDTYSYYKSLCDKEKFTGFPIQWCMKFLTIPL